MVHGGIKLSNGLHKTDNTFFCEIQLRENQKTAEGKRVRNTYSVEAIHISILNIILIIWVYASNIILITV